MKLIILDRDGVINHDSDQFIKSPEEWQPIDGSLDAIAFLTQAGYTIAVATNQSGIARGYFNVQTLNEMHAKMHKLVRQAGGEISGVWFCPHTADSQCDCRKPKPGMVLDILDRFQAQAAEHAQADAAHLRPHQNTQQNNRKLHCEQHNELRFVNKQ